MPLIDYDSDAIPASLASPGRAGSYEARVTGRSVPELEALALAMARSVLGSHVPLEIQEGYTVRDADILQPGTLPLRAVIIVKVVRPRDRRSYESTVYGDTAAEIEAQVLEEARGVFGPDVPIRIIRTYEIERVLSKTVAKSVCARITVVPDERS